MIRSVRVWLTIVLLTALAGASCGEKEEPMPLRAKDDAKSAVEAYLPQVLTAMGSPKPAKETVVNFPPCEGKAGEIADDGRYYASGQSNVALPGGAQQIPTLEKLRDHFQAQGWEVKKLTVHTSGTTGDLFLRNPADGFQLAIGSTDSPEWFIVSIYSPCYRPSDG